jgi:ribosomal subunit interface protein
MTLMNPPVDGAMKVQVSGKHVDVGDALRARIGEALTAGVGKYFDRGGAAEVVVRRDGHTFCVDVILTLASGQQIVASGTGGDAHAAFDMALTKVETRVRRYKGRLKNHHQPGAASRLAEAAAYVVLRAPADEDDLAEDWGADGSAGDGAPAAAIIAETQSAIKTMTVSMAVMDLDLIDAPVVLFRNAAHGGLSVVYRRADGNIGWIDPERTGSAGERRLVAAAAS